MKHIQRTSVFVAIVALLAGCQTTSLEGDKFGAKITDLRESVDATSDAVGGVVDNLDAILESADEDPRLAFNAFSKSVDNIEKAREKAVSRAESLAESSDAYFEAWKENAEEIISPSIRDASLERLEQSQKTFSGIAPLFAEADAKIDPLLAEARDLRTLLSQDLSVGGIENAEKVIKSTRNTLAEGKAALDKAVADLEKIEGEFIAAGGDEEDDEDEDD